LKSLQLIDSALLKVIVGSSPCRGATPFLSVVYRDFFAALYRFCTESEIA
jgi:hypothetical protein